MMVTSFDDGEVEIMIRALRYWRARRRDGLLRRTDSCTTPAAVDHLLAKLEGHPVNIFPFDSLPASFNQR